jgi:hypothetical protein
MFSFIRLLRWSFDEKRRIQQKINKIKQQRQPETAQLAVVIKTCNMVKSLDEKNWCVFVCVCVCTRFEQQQKLSCKWCIKKIMSFVCLLMLTFLSSFPCALSYQTVYASLRYSIYQLARYFRSHCVYMFEWQAINKQLMAQTNATRNKKDDNTNSDNPKGKRIRKMSFWIEFTKRIPLYLPTICVTSLLCFVFPFILTPVSRSARTEFLSIHKRQRRAKKEKPLPDVKQEKTGQKERESNDLIFIPKSIIFSAKYFYKVENRKFSTIIFYIDGMTCEENWQAKVASEKKTNKLFLFLLLGGWAALGKRGKRSWSIRLESGTTGSISSFWFLCENHPQNSVLNLLQNSLANEPTKYTTAKLKWNMREDANFSCLFPIQLANFYFFIFLILWPIFPLVFDTYLNIRGNFAGNMYFWKAKITSNINLDQK